MSDRLSVNKQIKTSFQRGHPRSRGCFVRLCDDVQTDAAVQSERGVQKGQKF